MAHVRNFGKTPFLWDRRDVRHELRGGYGFLCAHWAYDAEVKYDMERVRAYDTRAILPRPMPSPLKLMWQTRVACRWAISLHSFFLFDTRRGAAQRRSAHSHGLPARGRYA